MSEQYLGEIRPFAFSFPPRGWARCDGQLMSIQNNQALFALLGTRYGGNGVTTFALPDLRGCSPLHAGATQPYAVGERGGTENVVLTGSQMPPHTHQVQASSAAASASSPQGAYWASSAQAAYGTDSSGAMSSAAIAPAGGSQPHPNMSPFLVVNYGIALTGIFPSRD